MPDFLREIFSSSGFMPHGHCYMWDTQLILLHVISDALIALAYTSIPFTLVYFIRKRKDLPFHWMFFCFGVFIIACGATHVMEIWTLWTPTYWLAGIIKAITATASVSTAVLLVQLVPKALAIPSPEQLRQAHDELAKLNGALEARVGERTIELTRKNEELESEILERKRAAAAVLQSDARKTAVMEAALDAVVLMDHEGKITEFNAAAERTFGYAREHVLGKPLGEMLIPPSLRGKHASGLERYLLTGEEHVLGKRIEVSALRKDGTEFPAEVAVVRIRSEGMPVFTGYIRDITERRRAAESEMLRREKEAAEEAHAELETFSYTVAHDLRAPLRAINGFSTILATDYADKLDEDGKEHLGRIISGAERMAQLIDALLGLARLTRTEPKREMLDLTAIARKVVEHLRAAEPQRTVELVVTEGLVTEGDPQLVRALLENLIGNAWKFTGKRNEPRIELGRENVGGSTAYYVRDNGAGFDMSYVGKLFAPFRRLHSAEEFEGTGIGLATVQRIAKRHGGRVWAKGIENEGATFYFTSSTGQSQGGIGWALTE